ncbi:MAG: PIG-L deacetylase family protein [Actinomycetota bacterium]
MADPAPAPDPDDGDEAGAQPDPVAGPVLAVFAHPDDADIGCGGTLAKFADAGREVHLLILTNGDRGSGDAAVDRTELAAMRRAETQASAAVLGLASATVLDTHDGELDNTPEIRARVVRTIRELRPGTLVSCDPTAVFFENKYYNHADHRVAGWIALDSVFPGSGNPHFFADQLASGLEACPVYDVWLSWSQEPNHREDITGFLPRKIEALSRHVSQVEGNLLGFFEDWLEEEAAEEGAKVSVEHAESFRRLALD